MKTSLLSIFSLMFFVSAFSQSASDVISKADQKMRGKTSQAELIIRTIRPSWSREMALKTWIKGTDLAMLLILSPVRDRGIVYLKRKKEVWNWIPVLERNIKLPPSMMSQSWMGTDFTNDDLVKESSILNEYVHRFLKDTIIGNFECYRVECIPKPSTAVVWGKLVICIDKKDFLEYYTEFFDEDGYLVNTMSSGDVKMMDGRLIPTRFEMVPADKKNQKTEIIYKSVLFDRELKDDFFTIENMRRLN